MIYAPEGRPPIGHATRFVPSRRPGQVDVVHVLSDPHTALVDLVRRKILSLPLQMSRIDANRRLISFVALDLQHPGRCFACDN